MNAAFNSLDPDTWPPALTLQQIAAIYQRTANGVRCALKPSAKHLFHPAPYKSHPYRWRRVAVVRDLFPTRSSR